MTALEFVSHNAIWRGNIPLLTATNAMKLIELCELESRRILGIDVFLIFQNKIQPISEESVDYSLEQNTRAGYWEDGKNFIFEKENKKYFYEIVYEE